VKTLAKTLLPALLVLNTAGLTTNAGAAPMARSALVMRDDPVNWGYRLDTLIQPVASLATKPAESFEGGKLPKAVVSAVTQTAVSTSTTPAPTQAVEALPPTKQKASAPQRPVAQVTDDRSLLKRFQSWIMSVAGSMQ
jgi:hypothetical protein